MDKKEERKRGGRERKKGRGGREFVKEPFESFELVKYPSNFFFSVTFERLRPTGHKGQHLQDSKRDQLQFNE